MKSCSAETICRSFGINGTVIAVELLSGGHINQTYRVRMQTPTGEQAYLLQALNHQVFSDPHKVMENIWAVTGHIQRKNQEAGRTDPRLCLRCYAQSDGSGLLWQEPQTDRFWRTFDYIPNSVAFERMEDPMILKSTGWAFGHFAAQLADFDLSALRDTIPHFHDTRRRLENLLLHGEQDPLGRRKNVEAELEEIRAQQEFAGQLQRRLMTGDLPLRVTHNDTRANNVLFDRGTLEPLAVIDLDTVMPGLLAWDFGDAVRSACNAASSMEQKLEQVRLNIARFHVFAKGYLNAVRGILTEAELDSLSDGAAVMALELGVRYLDDYLTGAGYFHSQTPEALLIRGRCQLALFRDLKARKAEMDDILESIFRKNGH